MDIAELLLLVKTRGLDEAQRSLDNLAKGAKQAEQNTKGLDGAVQQMAGRLQGLLAGVGIGAFVSQLVTTQREFDVLNSSLVTVTGSSTRAKEEFTWIKKFAAETPYGLNEVTQAFIKMKSLGLDASQKALTSYGNTASAMGKDLNQMIEAVADAATGEFERLKEFGIRSKKEGDQVSFTFQGVTTTIRNSAEEITKYLQGLGDNQFGGAMAERAKTLDGAISNLGDTWSELFRTVNQQGAGNLIYDSVKLATKAIEDAITIIKALNVATDENAQKTTAMSVIQEGLAVTFETIAALGVNVKYVFVQIANEIYGIGRQLAALSRLDWNAFNSIADAMRVDAEKARKEVDATTHRILNARKEAAKLNSDAPSSGGGKPPPKGGGGGNGNGSGSSSKKDKKSTPLDEHVKAFEEYQNEVSKRGLFQIKLDDEANEKAEAQAKVWIQQAEAVRQILDPMRELNSELAKINENPLLSNDEKQAASSEKRRQFFQYENDQLRSMAQGYVDLIDPTARYRDAMAEVEMLQAKGALTAEQAAAAQDKLRQAMGAAIIDTNAGWASGAIAINGFGGALDELVTTGKFSFKSFTASILQDIAKMIVQLMVIKPLMSGLMGAAGGGSFMTAFMGATAKSANGNVFSTSGMLKSANGNIIDGTTLHGFRGGIGMLGEKGPEAIMPLKRGANGVLGVQVQGAMGASGGTMINVGGISITVEGGNTNEQTGDVVSKAVVEQLKRIADGQIGNATRPGGLLYGR